MSLMIHTDYPCHPDNYQGKRTQAVAWLVYHYVGAEGSAIQNAYYYGTVPGIGASAHLFIGHGTEAKVWGSVPLDCVASHCGRADNKYKHPYCRNANSIGIEICCHQDKAGKWYFDPETVDRAVELGRELMARYGIDVDHVLRHYDVTGKICPAPFVNDAAAWENFKSRLGEKDMTKAETQALIAEAVEAAKPEVYTELDAVPDWAQKLVQRAMGEGVIKGDGAGKLRLTDDNLVNLQMLYNMAGQKGSM